MNPHPLRVSRLAAAGLPVLAAAALAIGGCATTTNTSAQPSGGSGSASTTESAGSAAARSALLASIQQLNQTPYRYHVVSGGLTGDGAADPASKAATVTMTGTDRGNSVKIDMVALNTDFWLRLNLGNANQTMGISTDKWLHIDAARLGAGANLPVDPSGGAATASGLLSGVTSVQQVDSRHFSGTLDLTKATGVSGIGTDLLNRAGAQTSVPFTAALDSQGRLSDLKVDLSSIDRSLALDVSYSDYGTPVTVTRPDPSMVAEAPDSVYQFFKR